MPKSLKHLTLLALAGLTITHRSLGQGAAPPAPPATSAPAPAGDDLELPVKPGATAAAPPASAAAPAAPPSAGPSPAASGAVAPIAAAPVPPPPPPTPAAPSAAGEKKALPEAWPLELRIGGYLQAQFETSQLSEDQLQQGGTPLNQNRFLIRRARLRLDRDWEYARGTLELDANTSRGVTFGIRRAEASLLYRGTHAEGAPPLVVLTAGVMDVPFGYELLEPTRERPFMERTTGGLALFPTDMDVGARLSGGIDFFRYAVAIMNGEPVDNNGFPRDPNAAKDVVGRFGVDVHPTDGFTLGGGASFATGKGFHAGQDAGKNQLVWRDADQNGAFSSNEVVLVPASGATPSKNFDRWVLGLDIEASLQTGLGRSKVYAEGFVAKNYDRGLVPADPIVTSVDVREAGAYAALLQDVTKYGLVGFRAGFYDPNADTAETRRGRLLPLSQTIWTLSPLAGLTLRGSAKLLFQYDFVLDKLGRDARGVPADAKNDAATVRLQVEL